MINIEQLSSKVIANAEKISAVEESIRSAHKRIDENDKVTAGIYELSASITGMTAEIKAIAERMDENNGRMNASIEKINAGQKAQGERIGALETALVALSKLPDIMEKLSSKVDAIEKEPAMKWKNLVSQVVQLVVAAVAGGMIMKLM